MWRPGAAAFAVTAALLAAGCSSGGDVRPKAGEPSRVREGVADRTTNARSGPLATFYNQRLHWRDCRGDFQCSRLVVPRDYAEPAGSTISIAVVRLRSSDEPRRSLILNPGGPGGSGIDYARAAEVVVSDAVRRLYDVVG